MNELYYGIYGKNIDKMMKSYKKKLKKIKAELKDTCSRCERNSFCLYTARLKCKSNRFDNFIVVKEKRRFHFIEHNDLKV